MNSLGSRLKKARENKRLTQMDVAKKLGVSNGAISGYERDYRDPDTETLLKLATLYEVSVDYLTGHSENDQSQNTQKESVNALPESLMLDVIEKAEKEFGVSLRDDPVVEEAVRNLITHLAKMKQTAQKTD